MKSELVLLLAIGMIAFAVWHHYSPHTHLIVYHQQDEE
jgi:hypothetical protein